MGDVLIRQLLPADAPAYRAHRLRGFQEHAEAFTSSFEEESLRPTGYSEQRLADGSSATFWGAFVDTQLAGVVGLDRETRTKNRHKAVVIGMYVAPEFAGLGLAGKLLQVLLDQARSLSLELLVLTVTAGNGKAQRLYERAGFAVWGAEPRAIQVDNRYYDKLHMFLSLPAPPSP